MEITSVWKSSSTAGGGSFWNMWGVSSNINTILEKKTCTLEDLLDEEDILQEVKSQNRMLIEYLSRPDTLLKLFEYITVEPEAPSPKRKTKYPLLACEILCVENWEIFNAILKSEPALDFLFSFLDKNPPLPPLLSSFASRVIIALIMSRPPEALEYIKRGQVIAKLLHHLGNDSIMEILQKIISLEEIPETVGVIQWLGTTEIVPNLVSKMDPELDENINESAGQTLTNIIDTCAQLNSYALIIQLENEKSVNQLFEYIFSGSNSALLQGLSVLIALLRTHSRSLRPPSSFLPLPPTPSFSSSPVFPVPSPTSSNPPPPLPPSNTTYTSSPRPLRYSPLPPLSGTPRPSSPSLSLSGSHPPPLPPLPIPPLIPLFAISIEKMDHFKEILQSCQPNAVGFTRLKIVEFYLALLQTRNKIVETAFIKQGTLQVVLDLFFTFHWNNFLHSYVEQIVKIIIENQNEELQVEALVARILHETKQNTNPQSKNARVGYMGYINNIAAALANSRSPAIQSLIEKNDEWKIYFPAFSSFTPLGGPLPQKEVHDLEFGENQYEKYALQGYGDESEDL